MTAHDLEKQRALSEAALLDASYDFTAKYMAVCHLHSLARTDPWVINQGTISTLRKVLEDSRISRETQAYFFYREIAGTLCSLIIHSDHMPDQALAAMKSLLRTTRGRLHRAIAEALGALPFSVNGPEIASGRKNGTPLVTWSRLCEEIETVIFRNAWLLGKLTSLGIVHSAPIPLFHNRVQRHRRRDHGFYEWPRAGRLDGWLASCFYSKMGVTGIRDFEHLIGFKGLSRRLYIHMGAHFLSLLLVAGSYFRNKDRTRIGLDTQGRPVDARNLFDKPFLNKLIQGIFLSYYHGFVGTEFFGEIPLNPEALGSRMIDEMGVDRHMEEILRVADQREMTNGTFRNFLESKGYSHQEIKTFKKGAEDITIQSGPHLGGFNERISLPELIESVASMSALCIAGRYLSRKQNN